MDKERMDLSRYRLEKANACLRTAEVNFNTGDYEAAANRSYYAIYHCVRSIIVLDGKEFKRHMGNISYFRKEYIKTGKFDVKYSHIIEKAFTIRSESDYEDFYVVSKTAVEQQIADAKEFYQTVEAYLEKRS